MDTKSFLLGAGAASVAAALIAYSYQNEQVEGKPVQELLGEANSSTNTVDAEQLQKFKSKFESEQGFVAIAGDVGGTNVRLELVKLFRNSQKTEVIIPLTKYDAQEVTGLQSCIGELLKGIPKGHEHYPEIAAIGMAGALIDNVFQKSVNLPKWDKQDGYALAEVFGLKACTFINDFEAAGYGIANLQEEDSVVVGGNGITTDAPMSVKAVIGPGTGLGEGLLIKNEADNLYYPSPSEGGHGDFAVKTQEDWDLVVFARKFILTSNNVENRMAKGNVIGRMSIERLTAGPAVPMIYAFMKEKYPNLESKLEKILQFDEIRSKDVIDMALKQKDPLCLKVVEKIVSNYGTETGNLALKALPYGGLYLIGGVTAGLRDYILDKETNKVFMDGFCDKGRLNDYMLDQFKIYLVNPDIEVGLNGAEEKARREMRRIEKDTLERLTLGKKTSLKFGQKTLSVKSDE